MATTDMLADANIASTKCWQTLNSRKNRVSAIAYIMPPADPISLYDRLIAVKPDGLSANAWVTRAGLSRTALADVRRRGNASWETIGRLLEAIGVTQAEFEAGARQPDRDPPSSTVQAPRLAFRGDDRPRDVPILGTAECADLDVTVDGKVVGIETMGLDLHEVIDHARRPVSLDNRRDVYAIYFQGHSMAPRYEPGEIAYVDPKRAPALMDYVIVQLRRGGGEDGDRIAVALAKRLVRQSASFIELEQFSPPATFRLARAEIAHLHRIIPWDELVAF